AVPGDQNDLRRRAGLAQRAHERDAVASGQLQIAQHQMKGAPPEALERILGVERTLGLVAVASQELDERCVQGLIVVYHQDIDATHHDTSVSRRRSPSKPLAELALAPPEIAGSLAGRPIRLSRRQLSWLRSALRMRASRRPVEHQAIFYVH